jgi:hypothetical protein
MNANLNEMTASGSAAAFTTARLGGGEDQIVRKPVERKKKEGAGLKPDTLTSFVKGYRKA